jgi:nicotinamidase-related amidase
MTKPAASLALCHARTSQLLVIDVQERLAAHMPESDLRRTIANVNRLIDTARLLEVPIILTEQYAKGLGPTVAQVRAHLPEDLPATEKTSFSCCSAAGFERELIRDENRKQLVLVGMESHVCVLQTAAGLQHWGYQVFVVGDAVCSRDPENRRLALARMAQAGIQVLATESVAFEWLGDASHAQFRAVSRLYK